MNSFATKVEEASSVLNRYYINMNTMGFTTHEAQLHYKTMSNDYPTAQPREIYWLVCKSAAKRICTIPNT